MTSRFLIAVAFGALLCPAFSPTWGQDPQAGDSADADIDPTKSSLETLKKSGALRSSYLNRQWPSQPVQSPEPSLDVFEAHVRPILMRSCVDCHGPDTQEGNIRIDTLDADLLHGDDVDWWLEVLAVLTKGEMPPADAGELSNAERTRVIDWLSSELQVASVVRRAQQGRSSFRRMTRYEYNYALQDLLGLPYDFAKDLPPEPSSEDGFQNSSEMLHMTATQFATYRNLSRRALERATVKGARPEPMYWGISMSEASAAKWAEYESELDQIRKAHQGDAEQLQQNLDQRTAKFRARQHRAHYKNLTNGFTAGASWNYRGGKMAWSPTDARPSVPDVSQQVAVIPPGQRLIVELGDQIPEAGLLRVRVRACRASSDTQVPSLQLEFGWQASNDSQATVRISTGDIVIDAAPNRPQFYQWDIPASEIYPRNSVRKISKMGDLPSPSEYLRFVNSSVSQGDIQIDYVEVMAPVYQQWPPESHHRIFLDRKSKGDEIAYARELLSSFMTRAWRRPVAAAEIDQKLAMFKSVRPQSETLREAMIEVLATVLSSPKFLYVGTRGVGPTAAEQGKSPQAKPTRVDALSDFELATRLSMFLWCSIPDKELLS